MHGKWETQEGRIISYKQGLIFSHLFIMDKAVEFVSFLLSLIPKYHKLKDSNKDKYVFPPAWYTSLLSTQEAEAEDHKPILPPTQTHAHPHPQTNRADFHLRYRSDCVFWKEKALNILISYFTLFWVSLTLCKAFNNGSNSCTSSQF